MRTEKHPSKQIPPEYRADLNPRGEAVENMQHLSADEIKDLKLKLNNVLTFDQIQQLHIIPPGTPLREGAVYLDLVDADLEPFRAHERIAARDDQWLIAKHDTPYEIWNLLKGNFIT